jgi:hypothetical protein
MTQVVLSLMYSSNSDNDHQLEMKAWSVFDIPSTRPPFILTMKLEIQRTLLSATKKAHLGHKKCNASEKNFRAGISLN